MENILSTLNQFGLSFGIPVIDGNIHRCHSNAKAKKNKDGWYSVKEHNGKFYCYYGCWIRGENGRCSSDRCNGDVNIINNADIWEKLEKERAKNEIERRNHAYECASNFISKLGVSDGSHQYLKDKQINPCGALQRGNDLVIPVIDADGKYISYQTISQTGKKLFMGGGIVGGGCYPISGNENIVCICEGFATGASINMATGYKTLVAFNAGNIIKVAKSAINQFPNSDILICADNDHAKEEKLGKNVGIETGKKVASKLGLSCVWPTGIEGSDFNDLAVERSFSDVADVIIRGRVIEIYQAERKECKFDFLENPPGLLKDIAEYYNLTAVKPQPLFGLATGLILGSVILGRRYYTGVLNNYTSLYFLLVAKSGTGKDHPKSVVRRLLKKSNLSWMERAGGYTASNTIMKSLQRQPLQVSFFEEIGQKLNEAAKNPRSMSSGVFRQMLDIWSSCHSLSIGDEYSDGTVPTVERPALTFVGITTPRELFRAINESLIEQGFVNRLLPFISNEERSASKLSLGDKEIQERIQYLENKIVKWIRSHWPMFDGKLGGLLDPDEEFLRNPGGDEKNEISYIQESIDFLNLIEEDLVLSSNRLERHKLDDMLSRCREITMRISPIAALMDNQIQIDVDHVKWAYSVVRSRLDDVINELKRNVSGSEYEERKLEALQALRIAGEKGVNPKMMPKTQPWSKWTKKERDEILFDLDDSDLADKIRVRTGKRGPGSMVWVALK